jgi:hypothetical protein
MSIFENVMAEELERAKEHVAAYEVLLKQLPRGYVSRLRIQGRVFAYWKWRDGPHIKSHYLGVAGSKEEIDAIAQYRERKRLEKNLFEAKKEEAKLAKALRHYRKG